MRESFEAELDRDPANWGLKLIYADWLEEQGEHIAARGQRWMAENEKHPYCDYERKTWNWYHVIWYKWNAGIPELLFYKLDKLRNWKKWNIGWIEYPTRIAAESALAYAIEEQRLEDEARSTTRQQQHAI